MSFDSRTQITDAKYLDDLTDKEFLETVRDRQAETRRLELENTIYENFLMNNEPTLITGMSQTLDIVRKMQHYYRPQLMPQPSERTFGTLSRHSILSKTSMNHSDTQSIFDTTTKGTRTLEKGPRMNFTQKTDLVMREIDEMQSSLRKFEAVSHRTRSRLKAEIEESKIRDQEVKESKESFEQTIVIDAVDPLTQKIPAEKLVRYMQEWLKSAQLMLEKMRLRTSSLRIQQTKLKNLLIQKQELGECVGDVDFEKLNIENANFQALIDQKNSHLLELKLINGRANLMMTNHKKILQRQDECLRNVKKSIKITHKRVMELEKECELTEHEVMVEKERYNQLRKLVRLYQVPDVMEYIRKKAELDELIRNLKIWKRKTNIQKTSLFTYTKMMMHLTGAVRPRASWYDPNRSKSDNILMMDGYVTNDENAGSGTSLN